MTASVDFFCSPQEERDVLRYLTRSAGIEVCRLGDGRITPWADFSPDQLPEWSEHFAVSLWQPEYGPLVWYTSQPAVEGPTHSNLVQNLSARQEWDRLGLGEGDRLLDISLSPLLQYWRGAVRSGRRGPSEIVALPGSLDRVGTDYAKWVKRSMAWVRRRGEIVHDWRTPSDTIPNPHWLLSTVYALPDALQELQSAGHGYAILLPERQMESGGNRTDL